MDPFVTVTLNRKQPVVKVRIGEKERFYPLTAAGCRQAGKELFEAGAESWMCSSSVDFPQELKKGCRLDVRELMNQGFRQAYEKREAPRKAMTDKMLAYCQCPDFQAKLTIEEKQAFVKLVERVRKINSGEEVSDMD